MDYNIIGYKESIRAAISKRKHKINEYIPDELDEESSDADDEEEDMQDWSYLNVLWIFFNTNTSLVMKWNECKK